MGRQEYIQELIQGGERRSEHKQEGEDGKGRN
jgi:hypothetical protein